MLCVSVWKSLVRHVYRITSEVHCVSCFSWLYTLSQNKLDPESFRYNFAKIALRSIKNWYTEPVYDTVKLQYCNTMVHLPR